MDLNCCDFKKMTISDAPEIKKLLNRETEFSCEASFINLFVWQDTYANIYTICKGQLVIFSKSTYGDVFRLPVGDDFQKGIDIILTYNNGEWPVFWAQEGEMLDRFRELYGDKYEFSEKRDAFDYIYLQEDLANLTGKKYHSKRNHISAFSKKHEWRYEKITPENLEAVRACAAEWYNENTDRLDRFLLTEKKGIETVLSNMQLLNALGGAIFIEDKVVAFTLGSPVNSTVFDVHFEKALRDYSEAYTVINREFAKNELGAYTYINREDDMGLEGLRKAKLSYKPTILLKKYHCKPRINNE